MARLITMCVLASVGCSSASASTQHPSHARIDVVEPEPEESFDEAEGDDLSTLLARAEAEDEADEQMDRDAAERSAAEHARWLARTSTRSATRGPGEPAPPSLEALRASLTRFTPRPWIAMNQSLAHCPTPATTSIADTARWMTECAIESNVGWDATNRRWIVLDASDEYGRFSGGLDVFASDASAHLTLFSTRTLHGSDLPHLREILAPYADPAITNLITQRASASFGDRETPYAPLVMLGAPFMGASVYVETVWDLDHPAHVLQWISRSGRRTELARLPAPTIACHGEDLCDRDPSEPSEAPCTVAELRIAGELCIELLSIDGVASVNGSLIVLGTRVDAESPSFSRFHWVAALPAHTN